MFKKALFLIISFAFSIAAYGQLDNEHFALKRPIEGNNPSELRFNLNSLLFAKNNEYSNDIADGFTLLGYQFNPQLQYGLSSNVTLMAGVFLLKDFGTNDFSEVAPTLL